MRNNQRSAYVRPKLIHVKRRDAVCMRIEGVLGVKNRVSHKLIKNPVEAIRPGTISDVYDFRIRAERSRRVARLELEFLDAVDRWEKNDAPCVFIGAENTVDQ